MRSAKTMRRDRSHPQKISQVVSQLMTKRGYGQIQAAEEMALAWQEAVGANLASLSTPIKLKRGVLEIAVQNSVVLQELMFQKSEILEKLTRTDAGQQVKDIRFRVGVI